MLQCMPQYLAHAHVRDSAATFGNGRQPPPVENQGTGTSLLLDRPPIFATFVYIYLSFFEASSIREAGDGTIEVGNGAD